MKIRILSELTEVSKNGNRVPQLHFGFSWVEIKVIFQKDKLCLPHTFLVPRGAKAEGEAASAGTPAIHVHTAGVW